MKAHLTKMNNLWFWVIIFGLVLANNVCVGLKNLNITITKAMHQVLSFHGTDITFLALALM